MIGMPATPGNENIAQRRTRGFNEIRLFSEEPIDVVTQGEVFRLEGGPRFKGRDRGDSQPMKCAEHQGEALTEDTQTPCSHSVRSSR
jgi:hypothetical protein